MVQMERSPSSSLRTDAGNPRSFRYSMHLKCIRINRCGNEMMIGISWISFIKVLLYFFERYYRKFSMICRPIVSINGYMNYDGMLERRSSISRLVNTNSRTRRQPRNKDDDGRQVGWDPRNRAINRYQVDENIVTRHSSLHRSAILYSKLKENKNKAEYSEYPRSRQLEQLSIVVYR